MAFHETAVISSAARIGSNVQIGAFAIIGDAEIGHGAVIHPYVFIGDGVRVGPRAEVFHGAVIGKDAKGGHAVARQIKFVRKIAIGADCSIGPHAIIYYGVEIGERTLIGDGASIREQCRIGSECLISRYVTVNYNTSIGDRVKVMDLTHLTGNMTLEDDAFVSCLVATVNDNRVREGYGNHVVGPKVRRGAVVGGGATLLPAVDLGEGSFVGAGAVATRNVPAGETWLGNPARPRGSEA